MSNTYKDVRLEDRIEFAVERLEAVANQLERPTEPTPEFVTVARAASLIGIGEKALRGAVQRGEITVYDLGTDNGGRRRVRLDEVREWALQTRVDPMADARAAAEVAALARSSPRGRQ